MGSKSAQNLMLMPNLLSDYVSYNLNFSILGLFWAHGSAHGSVTGSEKSAHHERHMAVSRACGAQNAHLGVVRQLPRGKRKNRAKQSSQNRTKLTPPERFIGSKSTQNLMLMPNLLSDDVGISVSLIYFVCILD